MPELGHREQLSEVIRFVDVDFVTKKVVIKELFLGYIEYMLKMRPLLKKSWWDNLNMTIYLLLIVDLNAMIKRL
jgi:hypothetical protein